MHNISLTNFEAVNSWVKKKSHTFTDWSDKPQVIWALFILGLTRQLLLLFAYPPAHGPDSYTYFLQAEQLAGNFEAPLLSNLAHPLYPYLILVTFKWLGSAYWLIAIQLIMAAAIVPVYYAMLKPYNSAFALITGLIVLGDAQTAIVFNFTSTEPIYIFLLAITLYLFIKQFDHEQTTGWSRNTILVGISLGLLVLARPVARPLILLLAAIVWIRVRDFRPALMISAGFVTVLIMQSIISLALLGLTNNVTTGNNLLLKIVRGERQTWLDASNGPNSERYLQIKAVCTQPMTTCLSNESGGWSYGMSILVGMIWETVSQHGFEYAGIVWKNTLDFLSLTGQQYRGNNGEALPSTIQCRNPENKIALMTQDEDAVRQNIWGRRLSDYSSKGLTRLGIILLPIANAMCPPIPTSDTIQSIVDYIAFRYRSLGRPQPQLWYGTLLIMVIILPWARRFLTLTLVLLVTLLNHALISAIIINVQPRYVVVTNPLRAILLALLGYLILKSLVLALDRISSKLNNSTL